MSGFGSKAAVSYGNINYVPALFATPSSRMILKLLLGINAARGVLRPNRCVSVRVVVKCQIAASELIAGIGKSLKNEKFTSNIE